MSGDDDSKRLQDELKEALAPKPQKKLLRVKERKRAQQRWVTRQRHREGTPTAQLNETAFAREAGLVDPVADVMLKGSAGPALEPEFSGGEDAERFRQFAHDYGKNAARWAFRVSPLTTPIVSSNADSSPFSPPLDGYEVLSRALLSISGWRGALRIGDRPFTQIVAVGEAPDGVALFFRPEGGLSALAAVLEQSREKAERQGLALSEPLLVEPSLLATFAADLCAGKALDVFPQALPPRIRERWRPPTLQGDDISFAIVFPQWVERGRQNALAWCTVDLVTASLSVERETLIEDAFA